MLRSLCAGSSLHQAPASRRPLSTRQGRRFFRSTACGSGEWRGIESKRTIMRRVHLSSVAPVLAVATSERAVGLAGMAPQAALAQPAIEVDAWSESR